MSRATTTERPQPKYRKDYRPPHYWIDTIDLRFELGESETIVDARLVVRRDASAPADAPLVLDGEQLELRRIALDGRPLAPAAYEHEADEERLVVRDVPASFVLETSVAIRPRENTTLSGLYESNGILCTQCEAEGFRRITFFLDRPDVMARYTTTIVGDAQRLPVMLSNGNRAGEGELGDGRRWVRFEDPHPKPSYLFALVAGDLVELPGEFVTRSGRTVHLGIWVEARNADQCEHALRSLQRVLKWDEDTFGLECDLDDYKVVAVDDFNMGAMENKGLNVFNSKFVLARPDTATDADYEAIEGVIGHEYFHNWTGNRITCRDWFQLTLKEGLTVFRDQSFTADLTSAPVERIDAVRKLREMQFAEDAGPMAHPVRPESYIEMNNFYTATVYVKGAEVVRLYQTLLGRDGFRRGMDLYVERHDGQAVTCDDFRAAMADANGVDLTQLERWYSTAGTPVIEASGRWDESARTYALRLRQSIPIQPNGQTFRPLHVPVAVGLVGPDGADLDVRCASGIARAEGTTHVLELTEREQEFVFTNVTKRPVASVLRGFSAPVKLEMERSREDLAFLLAHDSDPFNRWDAGQELARGVLLDLAGALRAGREPELDGQVVSAFARVLADERLDGSIRALMLTLPSERTLAQFVDVVHPDALHAARELVRRELARALRAEWERVYRETRPQNGYESDRAAIDARRLGNVALGYLATLDEPATTTLVARQFETADNMTDSEEALRLLVDLDGPEREAALAAFHVRWRGFPTVLDKWFSFQALSSRADTAERVAALARHPDFTLKNPNRARSLVASFALLNQVRFHGSDGAGYRFLADVVLELQDKNPQLASRLVSAFNPWRRFDSERQELMRAQLERIAAADLSKDVYEIVSRALEA